MQVLFSGIDKAPFYQVITPDAMREDIRQIPAEAADVQLLINACWQASSKVRPSMAEVIAWLQDHCKMTPEPLV